MSPTKKRADILLVERGVASSRNRAQNLLQNKAVRFTLVSGEQHYPVPSDLFEPSLVKDIHLVDDPLKGFVSRAGLKMDGALQHLEFDVAGLVALDIGISTGGFSDCLLKKGVAKVVGVDVGQDQLATRLRSDSRLICLEKINARALQDYPDFVASVPSSGFDLIVIDVSFISLSLILPQAVKFVAPSGHILALVKPQFEVGPENLDKSGIVKNKALYSEVENQMKIQLSSLGMQVKDYFVSSIEGKDGNTEFFIYAKK